MAGLQVIPTQETWAAASGGADAHPEQPAETRHVEIDLVQDQAPTASLFARVASSVDWLVSGRRSVVLGVDDARAAEEGGAAAIAGGARTPQPRVGIRSTWKPAPPSAPPPMEAEGQGQEATPATSRSRFYHVFGGW